MKCFCYQDSPRRAHSIAAQGGINAAKNYQNDGDSVFRLFYDTIKGGDFRSREANVYRLAEVSNLIIDQCVEQGVPFAREYGGLLANRSFGGAQVSRTFYARGQTGQQLLLRRLPGALPADRGGHRDDVSANRDARSGPGRRPRQRDHHPQSGHRKNRSARRRCRRARDRRLRQRFLSFDQRARLQRHRHLSRLQKGRALRQSLFHPDPSDLHSGQRRKPIEADADVGIAPQRRPRLGAEAAGRQTAAGRDSRSGARLLSRAQIPELRQSRAARHFIARAPRKFATKAAAWAKAGAAFISISPMRSRVSGENTIRERYGNLFHIYEKITGENAYKRPMRIYPAVHYTMGGLWVDYNLMSNVPGPARHRRSELFRSRRQPARRQRAHAGTGGRLFRSALHPCPLISRRQIGKRPSTDHPEFRKAESEVRTRTEKLLAINGKRSVDSFHRELGLLALGQMRDGAQRSRACAKRWPGFRNCARNSGATSAFPATAKSSINHSNAPGASPISWSSPS